MKSSYLHRHGDLRYERLERRVETHTWNGKYRNNKIIIFFFIQYFYENYVKWKYRSNPASRLGTPPAPPCCPQWRSAWRSTRRSFPSALPSWPTPWYRCPPDGWSTTGWFGSRSVQARGGRRRIWPSPPLGLRSWKERNICISGHLRTIVTLSWE